MNLENIIQEIIQIESDTLTVKEIQIILNLPTDIIYDPDFFNRIDQLINAMDINHDGTFDEKDIEYFKTEINKGNLGIIINLVRACTTLISAVTKLKSLNLNRQNLFELTYKLSIAVIILSLAKHYTNFKKWINDESNKNNLLFILNTIHDFIVSSDVIQNAMSDIINFFSKKMKGCACLKNKQNIIQEQADNLLDKNVADITNSTKILSQEKIIENLQKQIESLQNGTITI